MPQEMKTLNDIKNLSAGISLIVLSLGFSFLGILSFFNRHYDGEAADCCLNNSFCVAGSVASLVTGAAFLLATCLYWSRDSARAVRPTGTALNKPGRSAEISVSADRFLPDGSACTALVENKPELKNVEPFKTVLSGNREAIAKLPMKDLEKILAATLTGMSVDEFSAEAKKWVSTAKHPRWDRLYTDWSINTCSK
jgi:hypothetical protein